MMVTQEFDRAAARLARGERGAAGAVRRRRRQRRRCGAGRRAARRGHGPRADAAGQRPARHQPHPARPAGAPARARRDARRPARPRARRAHLGRAGRLDAAAAARSGERLSLGLRCFRPDPENCHHEEHEEHEEQPRDQDIRSFDIRSFDFVVFVFFVVEPPLCCSRRLPFGCRCATEKSTSNPRRASDGRSRSVPPRDPRAGSTPTRRRRCARRSSDDEDACWGGRKATYPNPDVKRWLDVMAERGWTAPTWPKEYGGGGLVEAGGARSSPRRWRRCSLRPPLIGFGLTMIGPLLLQDGTEELQARAPAADRARRDPLVPGLLRAGRRLRPREPADRAPCATATTSSSTARRSGPPTPTRPTGCSCLVRTDSERAEARRHHLPADGHGVSPGVSVKPIKLISGASPFCETFLDRRARAARRNVVGEVNDGWTIAKALLGHERTMIADVVQGRATTAERAARSWRGDYVGDGRRPLADPVLRDRVAQLEMDQRCLELDAGALARRREGRPQARARDVDLQVLRHRAQQAPPRADGRDPRAAGARLGRRRASTTTSSTHDARLAALARQLDRGRHLRDPAQHHRQARARPAGLTHGDGDAMAISSSTEEQELLARTARELRARSDSSLRAHPRSCATRDDADGFSRDAVARDGRARLARHRRSRGARRRSGSASWSSMVVLEELGRGLDAGAVAVDRAARRRRRCCSAAARRSSRRICPAVVAGERLLALALPGGAAAATTLTTSRRRAPSEPAAAGALERREDSRCSTATSPTV